MKKTVIAAILLIIFIASIMSCSSVSVCPTYAKAYKKPVSKLMKKQARYQGYVKAY